MKVNLGKVLIDTELDHEAHKKAIEEHTHFFCDMYQPEQWFTQEVGDVKRFFSLHYNKNGTHLNKITSWDRDYTIHIKEKRVLKEGINDCFFTKDSHPEEDYEIVEMEDYNTSISKNKMTHWKRDRHWWSSYKYE